MTTAEKTNNPLIIRRPDDWHVHLRDDAMLAAVVNLKRYSSDARAISGVFVMNGVLIHQLRLYFFRKIPALLLFLLLVLPHLALATGTYNPLMINNATKVQTVQMTVFDAKRDREIPLLVYLQPNRSPSPVILFSHGLGGSREGNRYLGEHWAARGYVAVFLQHSGSDESVWKDKAKFWRPFALKAAATEKNFLQRVKDVSAVLDQLMVWNASNNNALYNKLDLNQVGMSGHSFGAITTQAVSGQAVSRGNDSYTDSRIKAAIMFSPRKPRRGDTEKAFSAVNIPWMIMTGTLDNALVGDADAESRREVYKALPAGNKYELVLDKAEHSAFGDRALPNDKEPRNPNHHRAILALSTAFWDSYLKNDPSARAWLDGNGARSVLETKDLWQKK